MYCTSHTDECERELEIEKEAQQAQEVEVITCLPNKEKAWEYAGVLRAKSVED